MRYLAFLLLAPTFAILGWLYWRFPKALPRTPARRGFDVAVLATSVLATIAALLWAVDNAPIYQGAATRWPQIAASLAAYHVYPVMLGLAWWVRRRIFAPPV
ncbi:MAG TPA: hypothetical protein VFO79_10270 [Xanthomonadales bacterium]|nr:hypothetical protein [Xanthomonadales bacterium]